MRTILLKLLMVFLATIVFGLAGCGGGGSGSGATPTTVANIAPVANAGAVQSVGTGTVVTLDGSASSDANGDLLTYSWAFTSKPVGSSAVLSSATVAKPTFSADVAGAYVMNLVVNDGKVNSAAVTVTINAAVANAAPVANAGAAQSVVTGAVVTLDGSASSDANGDLLTYSWAFTSKPVGSSAVLSSATVAKPTFTADVAGVYVMNLVVNDGKVNSAAVTVTMTAAIQYTTIGGIINSDTILATSQSPYKISSDIQIASGTTFTIQPGVLIEGNNKKMDVFGTLKAIGNTTSKVTINNLVITSGNNGSSDITIDNANLNNAAPNNGNSGDGLGVHNMTVTNSIIKNAGYINISGYMNLFAAAASNINISRNIFISCDGINISSDTWKISIKNNVFYKQNGPINLLIDWTPNIAIQNNSFISTDRLAIKILVTATLSNSSFATNNYWGTTNASIIDQMIYDKNDNLSILGTITYNPILAVADPNTPDPTPYL